MGRCNWSQIGWGINEREARKNALEEDRAENGHREGYSGSMSSSVYENTARCLEKPKVAKTCKIDKSVQTGARKWETVFVIEPQWSETGLGSETMRNGTQGAAIKRAKELALRNQREYTVRIDKRLVAGSNLIAAVAPKKSKRGKWLFSGEARD